MDRDDVRTLTERIDREFYVDRYGHIVRYQPHWEPITVTLSNGFTFTDRADEDTDPWHHVSLHTEILRQHVGDEAYYVGGYDRRGTDYLERELGWIGVGKCTWSEPRAYIRPTQDQINTLFDLGYIHMTEDVFYGTTQRFWYFER